MKDMDKIKKILANEGVVSIVTQGKNEPHLANTWNSYVYLTEDDRFIYPAGGMETTEKHVAKNSKVLLSIGSKNVEGLHGQGTGFLIKGEARFLYEGNDFNLVKEKFPWVRAAVEIKIHSMKQTI